MYRIGSNFQALPINAPKCPLHNMLWQNGAQNFLHREGDVNYFPSARVPAEEAKLPHTMQAEVMHGQRTKAFDPVKESVEQDHKQVRDRYERDELRERGLLFGLRQERSS